MDSVDSLKSAYQVLQESIIFYQGKAVGTVASHDPDAPAANYADCFVRDFVPCAFVYLLDDQPEIVRNFLEISLKARDTQEEIEGHQMFRGCWLPGRQPASNTARSDY